MDIKGIENHLITSMMHDYGVEKKRHICEKTPLHNPSNGLQHFVWNCQGKRP